MYDPSHGHGYLHRRGERDLFFHCTEIIGDERDLLPHVYMTYTKSLYPDKTHRMRLVAKSLVITPHAYIEAQHH